MRTPERPGATPAPDDDPYLLDLAPPGEPGADALGVEGTVGGRDEAEDDDPDGPAGAPDGVGLCLSGGGYRAMLFHVGGLRRLDETGWLARVTRVAAVSGGSITAGVLGLAWPRLDVRDGVAARFTELVEEPLLDLAGRTLDVPAVLTGLWPGRIARRVAAAYDRRLFHGATLQDLPDDATGPRVVLLATNLSTGALWRFSRPYMRDWRSPAVPWPTLPLAHAVAASSAFPPFLSPFLLRVGGRTVHLTDGGVYDNLGLEPILKRCATVLVSDGGGTFGEPENPARDWVRGTLRTLQTIDVQVRRLRRRQVVGMLATGARTGAFWAIGSDRASYAAPGGPPASLEATTRLARTPTRLARLDPRTRRRIVNWGYLAADAAVRTWFDRDLRPPDGLPYPEEGLG